MALFGSKQTTGSTDGHRHYVEIKAGKMRREGTWVYPDNRKGLLYIFQNSEDLMHFCWRDRTTNVVEDDLIIFPGECTYTRVKQCTTGRVYLLKFINSQMRLFYWLQEPKIDKDEEHCRRINHLLNNPPSPASIEDHFDANNMPYLLDNMSRTQLARIFGPNVAATLSNLLNIEEDTGVRRHNPTPISNRSSSELQAVHGENGKKDDLKPATESSKFVKNDDKEKGKRMEKTVTILENIEVRSIREEDEEDDDEDGYEGDDEDDEEEEKEPKCKKQ